jgi:hypothetical protein
VATGETELLAEPLHEPVLVVRHTVVLEGRLQDRPHYVDRPLFSVLESIVGLGRVDDLVFTLPHALDQLSLGHGALVSVDQRLEDIIDEHPSRVIQLEQIQPASDVARFGQLLGVSGDVLPGLVLLLGADVLGEAVHDAPQIHLGHVLYGFRYRDRHRLLSRLG